AKRVRGEDVRGDADVTWGISGGIGASSNMDTPRATRRCKAQERERGYGCESVFGTRTQCAKTIAVTATACFAPAANTGCTELGDHCAYLTRTTGIRARKITFRATEPNSKPATPPRPLLPMTISPHFLCRAKATMVAAGLPICV